LFDCLFAYNTRTAATTAIEFLGAPEMVLGAKNLDGQPALFNRAAGQHGRARDETGFKLQLMYNARLDGQKG